MSGGKVIQLTIYTASAGFLVFAAAYKAGQAVRRAQLDRQRRRREEEKSRARLRARVGALSRQLREAAEQWREAGERHGDAFPAWHCGEAPTEIATMEDFDALEATISDLAARVAKARSEYARQSTLFKMRASLQAGSQLKAPGAAEIESPSPESPSPGGPSNEEAAERAERERQLFAEEVSRLVETLEADASRGDRTAVEQRALEAVASVQGSRRRALLAQLHLDVRRANEAGRERRRAVEEVEGWRSRLLALEGPEAEALEEELRRFVDEDAPLPSDAAQRVEDVVARHAARRSVVEEVEGWRSRLLALEAPEAEALERELGRFVEEDAPLPSDAAQRVEEVVARAREAAEREYAVGVITEELENLGYEVEAGFETASADAPDVLLRKPDMEEDYHVSLRGRADASSLDARVVREGGESGAGRSEARARTDGEMERVWCGDFAAALAAAERRGVHGRVVEREEAGRTPVRTIAPLKKTPSRRRRRRRTGQRQLRADQS